MKHLRIQALLLAVCLVVFAMVGCAGSGTGTSAPAGNASTTSEGQKSSSASAGNAAGEEVVINYPTFQIGVNTAAPAVTAMVEGFNEKYAGQYRIQVEEIPGDANYAEKIKALLATDQLPDVVYGGGYALLDLCLSKAVDLTPYLEEDPEWKGLFDEATLEWNSRDGKVYAVPNESAVVGYYYNEELFQQAGIEGPAKTWDEFFEQCETLLAAGITPLSMNTANSGWTTQLWLGAYIGSQSQEMADWMNEYQPDDYSFPEFVEGLEKVQLMLQKYTTQDAIGGKYEHAANNLISGKTAMIANGPWMQGDFSDPEMGGSEEFAAKMKVAVFPGDAAYKAPMEGMFVCAKDEAHIEAAVAMVKYFTSAESQAVALEKVGMIPAGNIDIPASVTEQAPLLGSLLAQAAEAKYTFNYLQATVYPNLNDTFSQNFPLLYAGTMTPQEFADSMTADAAKNN